MAISALYGLVTICLFGIALAETASGSCPSIKTKRDFELDQILGKWYVTKRYFTEAQRYDKCASITYTAYNDSTVKFLHSRFRENIEKWVAIRGSLRQPNSTEPGQLVQYFQGTLLKDNIWILETNYDDFAVMFSCENKKSAHVQSAWILTRKQHPSNDVVKSALKVVEEHNLSETPFIDVDQKNCPAQME